MNPLAASKPINISEDSIGVLLNSDDFISILTPQGVRKYVNRAYCDFLKKPAHELIGKKFTEGFSDEKVSFYDGQIEKLTPSDPAITLRQKNGIPGKEAWVSWKATGIFNNDGILTEIVAIGRNVNDIVKVWEEKDKLSSTLNAFKTAIDTNIICTITDAKGIITYANENFCKVSKYTKEEIHGHTHNIVNSGHHPPQFFAGMWKSITKGKMWTADIKNKAKDGTFYWVNSVIMPIKDKRGSINGYLSLRILIDEQKKLEEERKAYLKSLEDMLFMVSHEIRTPITRCQGILHWLRDSLPPNNEVNEMLDYLFTSATELDNFSKKLNDKIQNSFQSP